MVNLIYQSGKGVDAYDCTATGIDFMTKLKEEIKMIGIEQTVYAELKCPKTDGIACPDIAGI
jgi:hypothetical protein